MKKIINNQNIGAALMILGIFMLSFADMSITAGIIGVGLIGLSTQVLIHKSEYSGGVKYYFKRPFVVCRYNDIKEGIVYMIIFSIGKRIYLTYTPKIKCFLIRFGEPQTI